MSLQFELAVRRNSLTYQFGLDASIKLDVLQGIFSGRLFFNFIFVLDSIVSCLAFKDFLGDFYLFRSFFESSVPCHANVNIISNIFCTGQTPLSLYIVLLNHLVSQGLLKLCKNVEKRLVEKNIHQRKFLKLSSFLRPQK